MKLKGVIVYNLMNDEESVKRGQTVKFLQFLYFVIHIVV